MNLLRDYQKYQDDQPIKILHSKILDLKVSQILYRLSKIIFQTVIKLITKFMIIILFKLNIWFLVELYFTTNVGFIHMACIFSC